ncbi:MAG TPA: acyl-CoA dehydrogenase family protein [Gammaproteobacteria bacterium]|nr:acyl-CoA dehydrogenase family protein [Gammaproteobacteria bacterium]
MNDFFQQGPQLDNQYTDDAALRGVLARYLPDEVRKRIEPGLQNLGKRAVGDLLDMAQAAQAQSPQHIPYDPWGRRIDAIETSDAWQSLNTAAAEEAIVASAYARKEKEFSRLHQFARLYLYHPSSAIYSCPLAMTDGAARLIELHGDDYLKNTVLPRFTSTDPANFWTAGQWMTERAGGSDVSNTATVARQEKGQWQLHGVKWFTSATTGQAAFTLARIEEEGSPQKDLSLFFIELRDEQGRLRNIQVNRLKDKLGTRALPTAELTLQGTPARLVGEPGNGIRQISTILNITRLYNACCAAGYMRRGLALAHDYATRRRVFGKLLIEQPLHGRTLQLMDTEHRAAMQLVFYCASLLGKEETNTASDAERATLRLLTPITKLYTAKQAVAVASEALECFGGAGYIEDTGLPVLLRDAQVLTIWEGTTNVLSLDVLRVLKKPEALSALMDDMQQRLKNCTDPLMSEAAQQADRMLSEVQQQAQAMTKNPDNAQTQARQFAYQLARSVCAVLLLQQAHWNAEKNTPDKEKSIEAAKVWCAANGMPLEKG